MKAAGKSSRTCTAYSVRTSHISKFYKVNVKVFHAMIVDADFGGDQHRALPADEAKRNNLLLPHPLGTQSGP